MDQVITGKVGPSRAQRWAFALIFITPALWSVNYLVGRSAPGIVAPHMLALLRWTLAGLILLCFAWPELWAKRAALRHQIGQCLVLGALGMWICGAWVYIGAQSTSATNIALIYALSPVFIALVSATWLRENLSFPQWLGIGLAFFGLVHVVIQGQWRTLGGLDLVAGDAWILACTFSWTAYAILLKRWPSDLSPLARLVLVIAGGVTVLAPLTALEWASGWPFFNQAQPTVWGWKAAALVGAAALLPGAGAYLAYATLQKELGAAKASLTLYLGPLYASGVAWWLLAEPIASHHVIGAAAILPGIFLASRSRA